MNISINMVLNLIITTFFLLSITLPKVYSSAKLVLLLVIFAVSLIYLLKNKNVYISKNILAWYLLFIFYHLFWILIGFLNSNYTEALINNFRLFVIYPLIFLVFTMAISRTNTIKILLNCIIYGNFIIAIYTLLVFIDSILAVNLDFLYNFTFTIGQGVHEGYTKVGGENLKSLFFTFPFVLFNYMNLSNKNKKFAVLNIVITIIAILVSGMRMLQIIALLSIIIFLILQFKEQIKKFSIKNYILYIFYLFVSGVVIYILWRSSQDYIALDTITQRIAMAFEPSSDNVRYIQIIELLKAFTDNPILGVGFGEGISSIVRSVERPWSYEVTYVLTLFQTGILGFIIYISLLFYNIYLTWKLKRQSSDNIYAVPLFFGYLSFLIACFSNPLLTTFDFIWVLYIIPMYFNFLVKNTHVIEKNNL